MTVKGLGSYHALLILVMMPVLFTVFAAGCTARDPAAIAIEVAEKWASENIDTVSKDLTAGVVKDNLLLKTVAAAAVEKEINQRIAWKYSTPEEIGTDLYGVVATAYSDVEIPVMGTYRISLNYNLEIDTANKQVLSAAADISSLSFKKQ